MNTTTWVTGSLLNQALNMIEKTHYKEKAFNELIELTKDLWELELSKGIEKIRDKTVTKTIWILWDHVSEVMIPSWEERTVTLGEWKVLLNMEISDVQFAIQFILENNE